ncbi:Phosphatidylinositol 3-and 4-kinase [Balamuthia mandrillaris]
MRKYFKPLDLEHVPTYSDGSRLLPEKPQPSRENWKLTVLVNQGGGKGFYGQMTINAKGVLLLTSGRALRGTPFVTHKQYVLFLILFLHVFALATYLPSSSSASSSSMAMMGRGRGHSSSSTSTKGFISDLRFDQDGELFAVASSNGRLDIHNFEQCRAALAEDYARQRTKQKPSRRPFPFVSSSSAMETTEYIPNVVYDELSQRPVRILSTASAMLADSPDTSSDWWAEQLPQLPPPLLSLDSTHVLSCVQWNPIDQDEVVCSFSSFPELYAYDLTRCNDGRAPTRVFKTGTTHSGSILDVCFVPERKQLVCVGRDSSIKFWDYSVQSSKPVFAINNNKHHSNGAGGPSRKKRRLLHYLPKRRIQASYTDGAFNSVQARSDGRMLYVGTDNGEVHIYDIRYANKEVEKIHLNYLFAEAGFGPKDASTGISSICLDPSNEYSLAFQLHNSTSGVICLSPGGPPKLTSVYNPLKQLASSSSSSASSSSSFSFSSPGSGLASDSSSSSFSSFSSSSSSALLRRGRISFSPVNSFLCAGGAFVGDNNLLLLDTRRIGLHSAENKSALTLLEERYGKADAVFIAARLGSNKEKGKKKVVVVLDDDDEMRVAEASQEENEDVAVVLNDEERDRDIERWVDNTISSSTAINNKRSKSRGQEGDSVVECVRRIRVPWAVSAIAFHPLLENWMICGMEGNKLTLLGVPSYSTEDD